MRCEHITGLIPREENSLESESGALVGDKAENMVLLGAVDGISGLLVNNEEEVKVRGVTGVAFDDDAAECFRFLFRGCASVTVEELKRAFVCRSSWVSLIEPIEFVLLIVVEPS
jgi:hypothetical protein